MNDVELRKLDLNLLLVLTTMVELGSVTATAERLYLTQSAISAALGRLRDALGEELFVRVGRGLQPTARTRALAAGVGGALATIHRTLFEPPRFDPAASDRVFRLGVPDNLELSLVPRLLVRLARAAPRARLVVRPIDFRTAPAALDENQVDLLVSVLDEMPSHVRRERFRAGGFRALYHPRRLRLGPRPSLAAYLACRHVIVSYGGDLRGVVEDTLGRRGLTRDVALSLPRFSAIPDVLAAAPLVATVPASVAQHFARTRGLRQATLPFQLPTWHLEMAWSELHEGDPAHAWLRGEVRACLKAMEPRNHP